MSTVTHSSELQTQRAWTEYAASLDGLEGVEYELAEQEAWERLQDALREPDGDDPPLAPPTV
jgi:hypothetical protein